MSVHTLGMTTSQLANFARQSTPEQCAVTIEIMGNKIDNIFNMLREFGVAPADRAGLEHQIHIVLAACSRMKSSIKGVQTALNDLREAQDFWNICQNDPANALATGAMRDANEWLANAQAGLQTAAVVASRAIGGE